MINNIGDWSKQLIEINNENYLKNLSIFLNKEINLKKIIYPPKSLWFKAFEYSSFVNTKVVIIGQDPYHQKNQAEGLSFSVTEEVRTPPSLKNIFKELSNDLDINIPQNGSLKSWAKQGVLLLNTILTVEKNKPLSHAKKGWEEFTDYVIKVISNNKKNVVFILWGSYAQKKEKFIDSNKHLVLKASHPSPLSAYNGFFGCKHFSKTNKYLATTKQKQIVWNF